MKALALAAFLLPTPALAKLTCDISLQGARAPQPIATVESNEVAMVDPTLIAGTHVKALVVVDRSPFSEEAAIHMKKYGERTMTTGFIKQNKLPADFSFGGDAATVGGRFTVHCHQ